MEVAPRKFRKACARRAPISESSGLGVIAARSSVKGMAEVELLVTESSELGIAGLCRFAGLAIRVFYAQTRQNLSFHVFHFCRVFFDFVVVTGQM